MNHPRETIAAAFFGLFGGLVGAGKFVSVTRVLEVPGNVDATQEPALYVVEDFESTDEKNPFGLQKYLLDWRLVIYAAMPDESSGTAPGSVLNPLLDLVDGALNPIVGERQTLGGLVENCWIDGKVWKAAGSNLGPHIVGVIPISILTGA